MRVFKETQAFRQWWLMLILSGTFLIIGLVFFKSISSPDGNFWKAAGLFIVLTIIGVLLAAKLHTKIGPTGIDARFEPFSVFKKHYRWNDISRCYVRKYSPISEYGGYGVRGLNKAKAYNVAGNMGIQIITKNDEKFLIGTQKPDEAKRVIKRYLDKIEKT